MSVSGTNLHETANHKRPFIKKTYHIEKHRRHIVKKVLKYLMHIEPCPSSLKIIRFVMLRNHFPFFLLAELINFFTESIFSTICHTSIHPKTCQSPRFDHVNQWRSQPDIRSCKCKFFCVYRPYKESISEEMNNDNDLNLHLHDQMSGWLRY